MRLRILFVVLAIVALLAAGCSKSEEKKPGAVPGEEIIGMELPPEPAPADEPMPVEEGAEMEVAVIEEEPVAEEAAPAAAEEAAEEAAPAEGIDIVEVIAMNEPSYEHKKPIVSFSHKKHFTDYKVSCGDCHHDSDGQPLADLEPGEDVEQCIACHDKPGEMPKAEKKALKKLPPEEALSMEMAYHAEALHTNCRDCHKAWNKEHGKRGKDGAPTSCTACHAK